MGRLDGKVCIITGASSGIGAKAAEIFAKEGAKLVIAARRADLLNQVAEKIKAAGGEVNAIPTDISDCAQVEAMVAKTMEIYDHIDVLVNNAGTLEPGLHPVDDFSNEELDQVIATNLKGTLYVTRAVVKIMDKQGYGNVVTTASLAGQNGGGSVAYAATKGGLIAMTKHIALRYAFKKPTIRANCVCPGSVWTDITRRELEAQKTYGRSAKEFDASVQAHSCLDVGISKSIDIANTLLFLASDESACINGEEIRTDFGCNM